MEELHASEYATLFALGGIWFTVTEIVFYTIVILAGIVTILAIIKIASLEKKTKSWPSAKGVVMSTEVLVEGWRNSSSMYNLRILYRPVICYDYVVKGKNYRSSRIGIFPFAYSFYGKQKATQFSEKFAEGQEVDVYYNPVNPAYSVLCTSIPSWGWVQLKGYCIVAIIITVISITVIGLVIYGS